MPVTSEQTKHETRKIQHQNGRNIELHMQVSNISAPLQAPHKSQYWNPHRHWSQTFFYNTRYQLKNQMGRESLFTVFLRIPRVNVYWIYTIIYQWKKRKKRRLMPSLIRHLPTWWTSPLNLHCKAVLMFIASKWYCKDCMQVLQSVLGLMLQQVPKKEQNVQSE